MKVAIIADVHSNIQALREVMQGLEEVQPALVVCAGDLVGYGAFPNECCSVIERSTDQVVLGNHDRSALLRDTSFMNPYAAKAILWTAGILNDVSKSFLKNLQAGVHFEAGDRRVAMYHGSIESLTEYVFEEDVHEGMLNRAKADVLILGHTHIPYVKRFKEGLVVNPGSVGQPRDGDSRASYGLLDTESMTCSIVRTDYDLDAAAEGIDAAGLPKYLADRLYLGR